MLFLTLWLLTLISERSIASKQRSVNLALETVLQFDKADDINVINKMQDFLSHIQVLLDKKTVVSDNITTRRKNQYKFTDFVEDLITTVNSFEDNDLKQIFRIVDKDFRTRRFHNDLIDDNVKRFVSRKLTEIRHSPAINIHRDLDRILRELRADKNKKNSFFLDFVNTLYKRDTEKKFSKLIKRLNLFLRSARKSTVVLKSIIEKIVNDVIFEHYNNLEDNEKGYIKKLVKAYFIDDMPTAKNLKIKQRAKETENTQETIDEKADERKPTEQDRMTEFQLTPKTFKDIPKETTKKIFTHITLYPKNIRVKKFSTGFTTQEIIANTPINEDDAKDDRYEEETEKTKKITTNQSVEINVNLLLEHSEDSLDREDSKITDSITFKPIPLKVFQRALMKTKYRKSSSPAFSIETFGNLYKVKTPKIYNYKETSRLVTYRDKTTMKDRDLKSTYVDDVVKEESVEEKKYLGHRRFNKLTNVVKENVPKSAVKDILETTKIQTTIHSFSTRALVPHIISSDKVTTPVVPTDKSATETTKNVVLNEIHDNEIFGDFKEATKKPQENNTTLFENDLNNHIDNTTIVSEASIAFNINNYIKNSEVLNLEDNDKKKQIEEKIRADFGKLLDTPTPNTTTDGFTDVFKELEDAFEI